jgi:septal ring-binding cell division protein DamX/type II secretory pathway predicted ATPase ExeA
MGIMSSFDNRVNDQAVQLSDNTMAEYDLREQPFTAAVQSGEWFTDDTTLAQIEDVKQALVSGDNLLLVLGPDGAGKSTLLAQMSANSGQRIQNFSVSGTERFSTANLFAGMLEAFKKQPSNDLKLMLDELIPCLQSMTDRNTLGVVVLDDAHRVPEPELTKLLSGMLYLNSIDETLLSVTLAGPTEFEERIPELLPEGADLPYSILAIEAFDMARARDYLNYRFIRAGSTEGIPFNEDELAVINEEAVGRPGQLHIAAAEHLNALDADYIAPLPPELMSSQPGMLARIGGLKLFVGALAALMIFAGLFWLNPNQNNVPDDRYKVVEKKRIETGSNTSANNSDVQILDSNSPTQVASNSATNAAATDADAQAAAQAAADKKAAEDKAAAEKAAAEKAEADRLAKEKAAAEKLAEEKAAAEKAAAEKAEADRLAQEKAAAEKLAQEKAAAASTADIPNLESSTWVLTQNPNLFTVQMSASTDLKSVQDFLKNNKLPAPNSIFSFNRNGATWYALVHGLYPSIEAARQDIEKMPASARTNQPWIRAVSRLQKSLKEQN